MSELRFGDYQYILSSSPNNEQFELKSDDVFILQNVLEEVFLLLFVCFFFFVDFVTDYVTVRKILYFVCRRRQQAAAL